MSLASGLKFLGAFDVYRPVSVYFISGESGEHAIYETLDRVCKAKGLDRDDLPLSVQFDLPRLANPLDRAELLDGLRRDQVKVCFLDPLYLCLLSGLTQDISASNVYQIGPLLLDVARTVLSAGCTPIILHHAKKDSGKLGEPLELTDLTMSGIAEFARQWLLISRRERFEPGAPSKLWVSGGGSCGQSGLWAVDVEEGELRDDFTGRTWGVTVEAAGVTRARDGDQAAQKKRAAECRAMEEQENRFLASLDRLDPDRKGASVRSVRIIAGLNTDKAGGAVLRLKHQGRIEDVPGFKSGKQPAEAVRRKASSSAAKSGQAEQAEQAEQAPFADAVPLPETSGTEQQPPVGGAVPVPLGEAEVETAEMVEAAGEAVPLTSSSSSPSRKTRKRGVKARGGEATP